MTDRTADAAAFLAAFTPDYIAELLCAAAGRPPLEAGASVWGAENAATALAPLKPRTIWRLLAAGVRPAHPRRSKWG